MADEPIDLDACSIPVTSNAGEFSVYQFFPGGDYEEVLRFVSAERAVYRAKALVDSVGAKAGNTVRVIITDGEDFTTFEWKHGEGLVFPPPPPGMKPYGGPH